MPRSELFPPIDPFQTGFLPVDDIHTLYWEQSGNPRGVPVLFLHGGPGAGASPTHRRFFDPGHYRIIIMDQRGAGRSTPLGEVRRNSTELLVEDAERLRRQLGVERWLLFGGSWGSTLALAYAQTHPERCLGLILRGIFLMRKSEIDWFLYSMRTIFPEAWASFVGHIPAEERGDLLEAYWKRLDAPDSATRMAAARTWSMYEGSCSSLLPSPELIATSAEDTHALGLARIEAHYFRSNRFTPEDKLLRDLHRIRHLPGAIIQGRYDIVCPISTADELRRAWPEADYRVVPDAGHSAMEPGIRAALVQATERFKDLR
ncbi:prolyl aminopeptidase [Azospirillum rugosum]|uniref:Proline iminopeptidase n=1 Tax=Azospirillum rugosum TaxID=416170 RepID=A0ABS4SVS9_9PROT|nr:prolyl aminopeptidase [Azospirillum rugosum]MBP2296672.1 proline iminopeptidase [Azospirillum rugosum]MDQ0530269.1 proline iminopeptidase [Azospirillum rugosum]